MSYACIFVPDFPAQAILRAEPELRDYALVVLDGRSPVQRPVAMNEHARRKGVQAEMPKTLLEQCPSVLLRPRSHPLETAAHEALLDAAKSFSPRVEEIAPDTLIMDLAGMDTLFGPSEALARELARRLQAVGLAARIAIASNPDAALAAARGKAGITVIPPGREVEVLGPLPLAVLDPPPEVLETLERWGIRDFYGLAALPTVELSERLGQLGVRLQALARGKWLRPLIGAESLPEFIEQVELEYPVEELEPLAFILDRMLAGVGTRLSTYSAAAHQIDLHLDLQPVTATISARHHLQPDSGNGAGPLEYEKCIPLPVPTRDAKLLLNLLRMQLEADPPCAPILKIVLKATPAPPRVAQGGLFVPLAPDPEKLEITLARIAGLVGRQNVGSPRLLDSHRPGTFEMRPFVFMPPDFARNALDCGREAAAFKLRSQGGSCATALPRRLRHSDFRNSDNQIPQSDGEQVALRIYRPPAPASVNLKNDIPDRLSFRGVRGRVLTAGGPWRTSGCWWQSEAWQYDEWDLQMETVCTGVAGFYLVYFDRAIEKWFVRGEYD
jgi:protein ImuB